MKDDDMSDAIRLLHSEDKPVYDSDDVYQKLVDRHSQIPLSRIPFMIRKKIKHFRFREKMSAWTYVVFLIA